MNGQHLLTILWLRWRLSFNQWRRAGTLNAILSVLFVAMIAISSVFAFFLALVGGILGLADAEPDHLLLLWDGLVLVFLFVWIIGLITELQRSEFLSLDKLLHLPISLTGAFALNYFSSLASLSIVVFAPSMIGLSIAAVVTHGAGMLLLFPLVVSFLLLVTAVTYQFRGWLATLMTNKRRRRTVITLITAGFILMLQLPNIANMVFMRTRSQQRTRQAAEQAREMASLNQRLQAGELTPAEHQKLFRELGERQEEDKSRRRAGSYQQALDYVELTNAVIPLGWLPYGVQASAKGILWPGVLGAAGMTLLGTASLWRSYRATLRFYTGADAKPRAASKRKVASDTRRLRLVEWKVPGVPEQAAAVGMATLRSLLRAPEAKMGLLTPIILSAIFGSIVIFGPGERLHPLSRPFVAMGVIGVTMFGLSQMVINLFGFDRHGFRAFVLWPAPRQEILRGKNLAVAPFALTIALVLLIVLQCIAPLKATHFLATLLQLVPTYLLFCLVGNMTSILAPVAVSAGSMKPVQPKFVAMLVQMLGVMLAPLTLTPAAFAVAAEMAVASTFDRQFPLYLLVSLVEFGVVLWLYGVVLRSQGHWLQLREPRILEIVAAHTE